MTSAAERELSAADGIAISAADMRRLLPRLSTRTVLVIG